MRLGMVDCPFNPDCHQMAQGSASQVLNNIPVSGWSDWTMFFVISWERFCMYRWSNLIHPALEVAQVCPRRVFTNDGYLSFMLPLNICTRSLQNMQWASTPWLLPVHVRWVLFLLLLFPFLSWGNRHDEDGPAVRKWGWDQNTFPINCAILLSINTSCIFLPGFSSWCNFLRVFHLLVRLN